MNGFSLTQMLIDGAILSTAMSVLIISSLAFMPRIWYKRFPEPLRRIMQPPNSAERVVFWIFALLFWGIPVGLLISSTASLIARNGGQADFLAVFLNAYGMLVLFNLVDWLIVDWLFLLVLGPYYIRFAGAEKFTAQEKFGTYGYHFRGFLKGLIIVGVLSLIAAGIAVLVA